MQPLSMNDKETANRQQWTETKGLLPQWKIYIKIPFTTKPTTIVNEHKQNGHYCYVTVSTVTVTALTVSNSRSLA